MAESIRDKRAFLRQAAAFLLPLLPIAYALDVFLSGGLKRYRTGELGIWNDVQAGRVAADLVIYGDSRAWTHIDPAILADSLGLAAYNLGIDGYDFRLQYLRHTLLLKHNRKPGYIIHSADVNTLVKRKDLYDPDQFLPFLLHGGDIAAATSAFQGYDLFDYAFPLVRYYGRHGMMLMSARAHLGFPLPPPDRRNGYQPQELDWSGDSESARKKYREIILKPDSLSIAWFDAYLAECGKLGIRLILVNSPELVGYRDFVGNRREMLDLMHAMARKHGIPYLDYSEDSLSLQRRYFIDSEHMNALGAELFTKKLIGDLRPLMGPPHFRN